MRAFTGLAMLALLSCKGDADDTKKGPKNKPTDPATPTTTTTDTDEPTDTTEYFQLGTLTVEATFGIGPGGVVAAVTEEDGTTYENQLVLHLGTPAWEGDLAATEEYCDLTYDLTGLAGEKASDDQWFRVSVGSGTASSTTCTNIDEDVWGGSLSEAWAGQGFELAVGPLTEEGAAILEQAGVGEHAYWAGGQLTGRSFTADLPVLTQAMAVDASMVVERTAGFAEMVLADEMSTDDGVKSGLYFFTPTTLWTITGLDIEIPEDTGLDPCDLPLSFEIGTGTVGFAPLADLDHVEMVNGPQGGWHIETAGLVSGVSGQNVQVTKKVSLLPSGFELTDSAAPAATLPLERYEADTCYGEFYGETNGAGGLAVLSFAGPDKGLDLNIDFICSLAGQQLEVEVEVMDLTSGATATESVTVIADLDPDNEDDCM